MKKRFYIVPLILIFIVAQLLIIFYSIPFVKVNNLLKSANNQTVSEIEEIFKEETTDTFISKSDYKKIKFIKEDLTEDQYIKFKTKQKLSFQSAKNIEITCKVNAKICHLNEQNYSKDYNEVLTISFAFKNGSWKVTNVE